MKAFLAYFDLLGFKKFIENNTDDRLDERTNHFGRNIERALSLDHDLISSKHSGYAISDISHSKLNCLTFSDTVVLWTNGSTIQDFEEILKVSFKYNHFNVGYDFPSRGCIVYGGIRFKSFDEENLRGGRYMLNMIYGKALIDAHFKAEAMSWAGCILDSSAFEYAKSIGNINTLIKEHTMLYDVPYKTKDGEMRQTEYALLLVKGNVLITDHMESGIRHAFTQDHKGEIEGRTKVIFDNTIEFLKAHRIKFPYYYRITLDSDLTHQVFGKFEEDYTHTIVTVHQKDGQALIYKVEVVKFDTQGSDRGFLMAEQIDASIFEEHYTNATR